MPVDQTASFAILPDGSRVVIPLAGTKPGSDPRLEITGVLRCAYNDQQYDALYACDASGVGDSSRSHSYLSWQPHAPVLEEADVRAHRYIFRYPRLAQGVSPTVRIDVDRFVNEFLIPPSEVRNSLSGQFEMTVRPEAVASPISWGFALAAVPALVLTGGVAWVIQRRMASELLDADLQIQLQRVRQMADAARRAFRREDSRLVPVHSRLKALEEGAGTLAKQVQQIRNARALHDRSALERDVEALQLRATPGYAAHEEVWQTLRQKMKALAALSELDRAETLYTSRLTRIEALLQSTLAELQSVRVGTMEAPVKDSVCRALDAEVSALKEAARQTPETLLTTLSDPN